MSRYSILYWQEIPSLVEAKQGRTKAKRQLSPRYQELIDLVAMKQQLFGTDDYLAHWRKGPGQQRDGTPDQVADAVAGELEEQFEEIRAGQLAKCREMS